MKKETGSTFKCVIIFVVIILKTFRIVDELLVVNQTVNIHQMPVPNSRLVCGFSVTQVSSNMEHTCLLIQYFYLKTIFHFNLSMFLVLILIKQLAKA